MPMEYESKSTRLRYLAVMKIENVIPETHVSFTASSVITEFVLHLQQSYSCRLEKKISCVIAAIVSLREKNAQGSANSNSHYIKINFLVEKIRSTDTD